MSGFREDLHSVHKKVLDGVSTTGASAAVPVDGNSRHCLQVTGITTATVHLERTMKPNPGAGDWETLGNVTADGFIDAVDKPALQLRANISSFGSGVIDAHLVSAP